MTNTVIVGSQWGDEGKGKIVDNYAGNADVVARAQGGNNAGHTVDDGNGEIVLHVVASGILNPNTMNICGNGMVINQQILADEIDKVKKRVNITGRLAISDRAQVIMDYHVDRDIKKDKKQGIGTTGRGIGPAYEDKIARVGARFCDFLDGSLRDKLEKNFGGNIDKLYDTQMRLFERIAEYICDTSVLLNERLERGDSALFECAQGTLLDIDHGTYPFVTSSNSTVGGVITGSGIGPKWIDEIVGIVKAYTTRVGRGPFPTELGTEAEIEGELREWTDKDKQGLIERDPYSLGKYLRRWGPNNIDNEYGATTGRERRCGWLDYAILEHAKRVNGLTSIALTKLDILTGLDPLRVCTGYKKDGKDIPFPASLSDLAECETVYQDMPGWTEDITGARSFDDLPENAQRYVNKIENDIRIPVSIISVGPKRDQTIIRN